MADSVGGLVASGWLMLVWGWPPGVKTRAALTSRRGYGRLLSWAPRGHDREQLKTTGASLVEDFAKSVGLLVSPTERRSNPIRLFYKPSEDLAPVYNEVMAAAQQIAARAGGYGTPGYLEELMPRAIMSMQECRARLLAEGRDADLKRFRKYLLSMGKFMDNGPYNRVFYLLVNDNLKG